MINNVLVSVLLPSYNHEDYIEKSIISVIEQDYKHIELIVIDDGSKDSSPEIISKLSKKYNFKFIHRENKGLIKTLNELILISNGKYLALYSSDDYWHKSKISEQVIAMETDINMKLCFTEHYDVDKNSNIIREGRYLIKKDKYYFDDIVLYPDFPPASIMIRKETLDKLKFKYIENKPIIDDLYLFLKILENGGYAYIVPKKLAYYRLHDSNSHSNNEFIAVNHYNTILLFKDKIKNWNKVKIEWSLRNANLLARGNKKEAIKNLMQGIIKFWDIRIYKVILKLVFGLR